MKAILIYVFVFTLASCCDDAKTCPDAKVSDFKALPYKQFSDVQFQDSTGRTIKVLFNDPFTTSLGSSYKGSCATMKPVNACTKSMNLRTTNFIDSSNVIPTQLKNFSISTAIDDRNNQTVSLTAFGNRAEYALGNNNEISLSINYFNKQAEFITPYKTYNNVFVSKFNQYQSKLIIDNKGRIVSVGLANDTLNLFYLVE